MRHSFFGASSFEDLSAEIVLTRLEAIEGTTIPIGIPVRQTCLRCGGRGETWQEWCGLCGGCGDVQAFHDVELRVPAGVRAGERFRIAVMPPGAPLTRVDVLISIRDNRDCPREAARHPPDHLGRDRAAARPVHVDAGRRRRGRRHDLGGPRDSGRRHRCRVRRLCRRAPGGRGGQRLGRDLPFTAAMRRAAWPRSGWRCRTSSCCPSARHSASTRSGSSCTTSPGGCSSRSQKESGVRSQEPEAEAPAARARRGVARARRAGVGPRER